MDNGPWVFLVPGNIEFFMYYRCQGSRETTKTNWGKRVVEHPKVVNIFVDNLYSTHALYSLL